ncbi:MULTISPECIES: peptide ABC transporter substrate-binding protein [unclassified Devosia]|jgi:oligopeptide transport system substrate-binding protein|uniref:peptide ABC transporter substrate-binding protein n=1 Tax=unclassified Devosia TaxID=196773 RepID=UPI000A9D7924|nr:MULTISPECIES: peptide ABC transporter substrate-binding protein [unclassified Devosia]
MKITQVLKAVTTAGALALMMSSAALAVTLNLGNGGEPGSLDPHKVSGDWENRIVSEYLEGLVTEDAQAKAIAGQAESWTISDDGLVYTFKIRGDAVWSDNVPVTAQNWVDAFQRLFDPKTASEYAYLQYPIKNSSKIAAGEITDFSQLGVKAVDDKTLEITLEAATPYFLDALAHYTAFPIRKDIIEKFGDQWTQPANIVGNGPYKIVEWVPGSYLRGVKSDTYYGKADLKIDEIRWDNTEDLTAALNRYRAGELDILTDFPADQYKFLQDNYPGQAHVAPFLGIYYYVLNQSKPPLDNVNIRKALSISVLRDVIGPDVLGTGELPAYGWVPPGTGNYEGTPYAPDWAEMPYDQRVEEAKKLMTEAGYGPDKPLKLQLRYNTNENHKRIAVAITDMWKQIGVEVELFNAETAVHYDALRAGDFNVGRAGWLLDYDDASNTLDLLKTGTKGTDGTINWGNNYGRYSDPKFDELMTAASSELDLVKRAGQMHEAEKIAMDAFAAIPIYWYVSKNVVSPKVTGFEDNAKDIHRVRWMTKSE